MAHLSFRDLLFLLPFSLAVLFMLWVLWNLTLQLIHKHETRHLTRTNHVGPLRDASMTELPRPIHRPEPVPLAPQQPSAVPHREVSTFESRLLR